MAAYPGWQTAADNIVACVEAMADEDIVTAERRVQLCAAIVQNTAALHTAARIHHQRLRAEIAAMNATMEDPS